MSIDWFTVGAQIVNFLILVWLLKRYLYQPILAAIDERESTITKQLNEAKTWKIEALKEKQSYRDRKDHFDKNCQNIIDKVTKEAAVEKQSLLEEAHKEYEQLRSHARESLQREEVNLGREIMRRTQADVFAISRKALADLGTVSLEEQLIEVFIERLSTLSFDDKASLGTSQPVLLRTAFKVSPDHRDRLVKAVQGILGRDLEIGFEMVPDLISGIEFISNHKKLAWSIGNYLTSLEEQLKVTMESKEKQKEESLRHGP